MFIDHEDRVDTAVRRLRQLGADPEAIVERFDYRTPTFAIKGGGIPTDVVEAAVGCELVVIDSLGEALAHSQLSQNDDGEVAGYMARSARPLADGGAAVLLLDHVVKDGEERGRWAIGSQRKLAAIDGAAYQAVTIKALTKESPGRVKITCSKDRGGNYQHGSTVALIELEPVGDELHVVIHVDFGTATEGAPLKTGYMEKVSRALARDTEEPMSYNAIFDQVGGTPKFVREAIGSLVDLGYVTVEKGPRNARLHHLERPFSEADLLVSDDRDSPRFDRDSTAIRPQQPTAISAPSPLGADRGRGEDEDPEPRSTAIPARLPII